MTCGTFMTTDPVTVAADQTVGQAAATLLNHKFIMLPVVDEIGLYKGLFGVFELLRAMLPRGSIQMRDIAFIADSVADMQEKFRAIRDQPITRFINSEVPVCRPDTPVVEALHMFYHARSTLPVVDPASGKLLGVVSYWDAVAKIITGEKYTQPGAK